MDGSQSPCNTGTSETVLGVCYGGTLRDIVRLWGNPICHGTLYLLHIMYVEPLHMHRSRAVWCVAL